MTRDTEYRTLTAAFEAAGFTVECMGGNTSAWSRYLVDDDGAFILITDDESGHATTTAAPAWVGLHDNSGDDVDLAVFEPGWDVADVIAEANRKADAYLAGLNPTL